jgi:hypothetical protein
MRILSVLPALLVRAHARHHPYNMLSLSRELREAYVARHPAQRLLLHDALLVLPVLTAEKLMGLGPWNKALRASSADPDQDPANPFATILKHFGTPVHVSETDLAKLPATGPTILYGLHPTGPLEVLGAMSLALTRRSDVKVVAVNEFKYLGNTRDYFLGVDFVSPEPERTENNRRIREAIKRHLSSGGALIIFPSAKPARRVDGRLWEPPFNPSAAKYGREIGAAMVPFMMETRLTDRFYRASGRSRFAALWRYALHARKAGRLDFRVGELIDTAPFTAALGATAEDISAITRLNDLMRIRVDLLAPDYHPGSFTPPTIVREQETAARKAARAALRQRDSTGVRRRIRSRS